MVLKKGGTARKAPAKKRSPAAKKAAPKQAAPKKVATATKKKAAVAAKATPAKKTTKKATKRTKHPYETPWSSAIDRGVSRGSTSEGRPSSAVTACVITRCTLSYTVRGVTFAVATSWRWS